MKPLLKLELGRAFRGRTFWLVLSLGCVISVIAACTSYAEYLQAGALSRLSVTDQFINQFSQSSFTLWMPLSVMHSMPNLFFFIAPLLVGLAYAWSWRSDVHGGYAQAVLSRTTRSEFYAAKLVATFAAGGTTVAVPLVLNFAIVVCLMPSFTPDIVDVVYTGLWTKVFMSDVLYQSPFVYVALRLLVDFALAGLWATAILAISLFVRSRVAIVALPYIAAIVVKYVSEAIYALANVQWSSLTILDQLKARGDQFYYTGWALLGDAAVLALVTVVVPLLLRKKDIL